MSANFFSLITKLSKHNYLPKETIPSLPKIRKHIQNLTLDLRKTFFTKTKLVLWQRRSWKALTNFHPFQRVT